MKISNQLSHTMIGTHSSTEMLKRKSPTLREKVYYTNERLRRAVVEKVLKNNRKVPWR